MPSTPTRMPAVIYLLRGAQTAQAHNQTDLFHKEVGSAVFGAVITHTLNTTSEKTKLGLLYENFTTVSAEKARLQEAGVKCDSFSVSAHVNTCDTSASQWSCVGTVQAIRDLVSKVSCSAYIENSKVDTEQGKNP